MDSGWVAGSFQPIVTPGGTRFRLFFWPGQKKSSRGGSNNRRYHTVFVVNAVRQTAQTLLDRGSLLDRSVGLWPDHAATRSSKTPPDFFRDVISRSISAVSRTATTTCRRWPVLSRRHSNSRPPRDSAPNTNRGVGVVRAVVRTRRPRSQSCGRPIRFALADVEWCGTAAAQRPRSCGLRTSFASAIRTPDHGPSIPGLQP